MTGNDAPTHEEYITVFTVDSPVLSRCGRVAPSARDDDHDSDPTEQAPVRPRRPIEDVELPDDTEDED